MPFCRKCVTGAQSYAEIRLNPFRSSQQYLPKSVKNSILTKGLY